MPLHPQPLVQIRLVVVDNIDTAQLRKCLDKHSENKTLPVAGAVEEVGPSGHILALLEPELFADLVELGADEGVVLAFVAVEFLDYSESLVVALLLEEPARGVWEPEDANEDDNGRETFCKGSLSACTTNGEGVLFLRKARGNRHWNWPVE
jgi:hypothetical protein